MSDKHELIGLDGIKHFLSLIYTIPYLKGEKPPGVLIVAPPGTGKSFALKHITSTNSIIINDITGYGMEKVVLEVAAKHNYTGYAIIPDLIRITSRKESFRSFIQLMNILLEEGLERIERANLSKKLPKSIRFGLIAALTNDSFAEHYNMIKGMGFLSRQFVMSFSYASYDAERIYNHTAKGSQFAYILIDPDITGLREIKIADKYISGIKKLSVFLAKVRADEELLRSTNQVRSLIRAQAALNGRDYVKAEDLNAVFCLIPYFRIPRVAQKRKYKTSGLFGPPEAIKGGTDAEYYALRGIVESNDVSKYFGKDKRFPEYELPVAIARLEASNLVKRTNDKVEIVRIST